jgi:hypothetical protein
MILYRSLPSQKIFHNAQERFKGFSGPIGSGKTNALCQEAIRMTYLNPGRIGVIGAPTYPMLRDVTQICLLDILDSNSIPYDLNKATQTLTMADTGSRILFRSLSDAEHLRGTNLAWFGIDELTYTDEKSWLMLEGRLRDPKAVKLGGFAAWTPNGHDWVYRKFINKPVEGYRAVIARPAENTFLLEGTPDFYERLKRSYDEMFYRQEVLGEYLNANLHRVYRAFTPEDNTKPLWVREHLPLLWALDFNVDPMSSVVAQLDGNKVYVLDEIVLRRSSTAEACAEFVRRFGNVRRDVTIYGDASGHHRQTTGSSDYSIIRNYFDQMPYTRADYRTPKVNPSVRDRISLVNSRLKNAEGKTRLWVDPKCKELIRDFEEVSYRGDTSDIDKHKDPSRTHLSDALGYLLWNIYGPRSSIGERSKRLV